MPGTQINKTDPSKSWWVLFAVGLGTFLFSLDIQIVNIALPRIVQELHTDFTTVQWVALSYLLMLSVLVLGVARLGDMWSKKWLYIIGLAIFSVGSLLCGLAPTIGWLIAARAVQGSGAIFIAVLAPAIVTEAFPDKLRGLSLGVIASIGWIGVSLGPTAGGVVIENWGWRSMFLLNLPFCFAGLAMGALTIPRGEVHSGIKKFDFGGSLLLSVTLTCLLLGITHIQEENFGGSLTLVFFGFSVISGISFLLFEKQSANPLLNLQLFQSMELNANLLLCSIAYAVGASVIFILPFFLELVKHYHEHTVGLLIAVLPIVSICVAPMAGFLGDRFGEKRITSVGLLLQLIGCLEISTFNQDMTILGYLVRVVPFALGMGVFQAPNQSAIFSNFPKESLGIASGLAFLFKVLGQSIGLAVVGILFSVLTNSYLSADTSVSIISAPIEALAFGEQVSFRLLAIILVVGFGITQLLNFDSREQA